MWLMSATAFAEDLWFRQMEEGDRVEITYTSTGCFHHFTKYLELRKQDGVTFFTEYDIKWSEEDPTEIIEQKVLERVPLSRKDIRRLDRVLLHFRYPKKGTSTTMGSLTLEYYEPSGLIKTEKLHHSNGLTEFPDVKSFR